MKPPCSRLRSTSRASCRRHSLAMEAIKVEQEILKEAVGAQDQVSAAYGGFNRINFCRDGSIEVNRILTTQERLAELQQHLALYFTGISRTASEIAQEQLRLTPQRTWELNAMLGLVDEAEAIVTNPNRPLTEFGRLLHESWKIKRTLTQSIRNPCLTKFMKPGWARALWQGNSWEQAVVASWHFVSP
jgi:D-glycero-alpha-D-manno-heptose-7-phosphate kinase